MYMLCTVLIHETNFQKLVEYNSYHEDESYLYICVCVSLSVNVYA